MDTAFPARRTILACAVLCAIVATAADAAAQSSGSSNGLFGGLFNRSSTPAAPPSETSQNADDPMLLKNGPKKPGVELYVAVAHLYAETGKYAEAEDQYQQAQKIAPDDIRVLLGYAMLKDQMNRPDEALKLYRKAEQKHPKQASVYNNLAIHFVRYGMVPEAIEAAKHAVELRPQEARYRNNLAALYVEANQPQEAFKQLRAVYEEPIAHYNLGYLLNKRGLKPAALQDFTIALQMSPGLGPARQWIERLSRERSEQEMTAMSTTPQQRPAAMEIQGPVYQHVYPQPALAAPQPQYVPPSQYRAAGPMPAQANPAAPPYLTPQSPSPRAAPLTAVRDTGVRILPPDADAGALRRLPPVGTTGRDEPDADQVAPGPSEIRR